jgi:hypothetical protein
VVTATALLFASSTESVAAKLTESLSRTTKSCLVTPPTATSADAPEEDCTTASPATRIPV